MPAPGPAPRLDRSQVRRQNADVIDWTEVDNVPFTAAPPLPARVTPENVDGRPLEISAAGYVNGWPQATRRWYAAVSTMPHAAKWDSAAWQFAFDSAEIHARMTEAWRGYTGAEIRAREKQLGTLPDYRRGLRIRYVDPEKPEHTRTRAAGVINLDDHRDL